MPQNTPTPRRRRLALSLPLLVAALLVGESPAGSLLGYYPFEGNHDDATENNNDATPSGSVSFTTSGFRGQGLDFNNGGSSTKVDLPINANPNSSNQISFGRMGERRQQ